MEQTGTIGIVGGGQLAQMMTQAALPLGFRVVVLDPVANSPALQASAQQITKDYTLENVKELVAQSDYLTVEFEEGVSGDVLEGMGEFTIPINPPAATIRQILDKFEQKTYLQQQGIAMGAFRAIETAEDTHQALDAYGGKMLIKTRRGGYDGYGNRVVSSREEIAAALEDFNGKSVYAEAFVPFVKELAVMAVRTTQGEIATYPVVETIQKNNICHEVLVPVAIDPEVAEKASAMAVNVLEQFEGAGAFGIEMFLTDDGQVLLNEIAPRVHNSGHYTIEACKTSQFENHVRAVTGLDLSSTELKVPAAVMINILGERNGPVELTGVKEAEAIPNTKVHIYGKSPTKVGRKMGHITATGATVAEARERAEEARKLISI